MGAFKIVEEDFVRVWLGAFVLADAELVEALRRCRDCMRGGRERSCLMGSVVVLVLEVELELRVEDDLCKLPVVGLLILAREGGGRMEAALLITLPVALGGLEDTAARVEGFTGSRLGDWLDLGTLDVPESFRSAERLEFPFPISPVGFRRERVREGKLDMTVMLLFTWEGCLHGAQTNCSGLLSDSGGQEQQNSEATTTELQNRVLNCSNSVNEYEDL